MLTTSEPVRPVEFDKRQLKRASKLLKSIFNAYFWMYFPSHDELHLLQTDWGKKTEVVMPTFLHYFNMGMLASVEQMIARTIRYLSPFDDTIRDTIGVTVSDALRVAQWISCDLQQLMDELPSVKAQEEVLRKALLNRALNEQWTDEQIRAAARQEPYYSCGVRFRYLLSRFNTVLRDDLQAEFGEEIAEGYWNAYVIQRGSIDAFTYMTEDNPAEQRPLYSVGDGIAMCASANSLFYAILIKGERVLMESTAKDSFTKRRDREFEEEVETCFRKLFGNDADYWPGLYETPLQQYEHDLVIKVGRTLLVIEAKASPPVEPFRDPDKAFTRIERAFKSDRGIQKGFDQALRVEQELRAGNHVPLYDSKGDLAVELMPSQIDEIFCICVTRDDFGPLAIDLSLLLKKGKDDPYPWAVNITDLENLFVAWDHLELGIQRFFDYLRSRIQLHGKIIPNDELEIAGYYIQHSSLSKMALSHVDRVVLDPHYTDVFTEIYLAEREGRRVSVDICEPVLGEFQKVTNERVKASSGTVSAKGTDDKVGRNAVCLCGSGKKFKRCCGV
jgi:hypothetical protein